MFKQTAALEETSGQAEVIPPDIETVPDWLKMKSKTSFSSQIANITTARGQRSEDTANRQQMDRIFSAADGISRSGSLCSVDNLYMTTRSVLRPHAERHAAFPPIIWLPRGPAPQGVPPTNEPNAPFIHPAGAESQTAVLHSGRLGDRTLPETPRSLFL